MPVTFAEPLTLTLLAVLFVCLSAAAVEPEPVVQPPYMFVCVPLATVIAFSVVVLPAFERPPQVLVTPLSVTVVGSVAFANR